MTVNSIIRYPINLFLLAVSFWVIGNGVTLLREKRKDVPYSFAFRKINVYLFLVMVLLSADRLFMQVNH